MIHLLPAEGFRRERWANGGGWTREIVRARADGPAEDGDSGWDWRASVAELAADGPFSIYPGFERELVLVSGHGLALQIDGQSFLIAPPHGRLRFDGGLPVLAQRTDGPVTAFNLIWRRGAIDAQLLHRPIVGAMLFFGEPGVTWLLYVLAGQVRTPEGVLDVGDAAQLRVAPGDRSVIEGGGEVLLVKLAPPPPAENGSA